MLTEYQQNIFDKFLNVIESKKNLFISSKDRGIGKTYILNELAFTLQALGYKVYVLTPHGNHKYFANKIISHTDFDFTEIITENIVIIVDEEKYKMIEKIANYCKYRQVPIVGYVDY